MEDITECEGMRKSFAVGIEALEKRIPKTVIYDTYDDTFSCPECDSDITNTDYTYCPYCGIRLGDVVGRRRRRTGGKPMIGAIDFVNKAKLICDSNPQCIDCKL